MIDLQPSSARLKPPEVLLHPVDWPKERLKVLPCDVIVLVEIWENLLQAACILYAMPDPLAHTCIYLPADDSPAF